MSQLPAFQLEKMKVDLIEELKELFGDPIPNDKVDAVRKYIDQRRKRERLEHYQRKSDFHTLKDVMTEVCKVVIKKRG